MAQGCHKGTGRRSGLSAGALAASPSTSLAGHQGPLLALLAGQAGQVYPLAYAGHLLVLALLLRNRCRCLLPLPGAGAGACCLYLVLALLLRNRCCAVLCLLPLPGAGAVTA